MSQQRVFTIYLSKPLQTQRWQTMLQISFKVEGTGTQSRHACNHFHTDSALVQGVNFRSFTVKQAKSLGITGNVQNENDGTVCFSRLPSTYIAMLTWILQVTGEAQGDSSALDKFQQHLNRGPSAASVTKVHINNIKTKEGESDFTQWF